MKETPQRMYQVKERAIPGAALKCAIDRMEEMWMEPESGDLSESSARMLHRDLFELIGMVKGLMMALELNGQSSDEIAK